MSTTLVLFAAVGASVFSLLFRASLESSDLVSHALASESAQYVPPPVSRGGELFVPKSEYAQYFTPRHFAPSTQRVASLEAPPPMPLRRPPPPPVLSRPMQQKPAHTELVEFKYAPFPFGEKEYTDAHTLLHIPSGFDPKRPGVMLVFFHGHGATLERDVLHRQQVPAQVSASGINAVLVAPQFAVDAADSSAGKFSEAGGFGRFVDEAAAQLAKLSGDPGSARYFARMPIVLVAYSGGYLAAASSIYRGGLGKNRIRGVVLLDALYGESDKFASWVESDRSRFFISAYTSSTKRRNLELERVLADREVEITGSLKQKNLRGTVAFMAADPDIRHRDFVTEAWTENPIKDVLAKLDQFKR